MIRDFTFGQFFPGNSILHRLDPRTKLLWTIAYIVLLFVCDAWISYLVPFLYLVLVIWISKISWVIVLRGVKPVLPLIVFTSVLNMFFVTGTPIVSIGFFHPTYEGLALAVRLTLRIVLLIMGTSMLTYTTSPIALTDGMEQLLRPLEKLRFPVHEMSMIMSIALRFIPTLVEETDKIMSAQKARGADMESGSVIERGKAMIPLLIPLFVSAFRRAEELAEAMECRCYRGGEGRTKLRQLCYTSLDAWTLLSAVVAFGLVIGCNVLF